MASAVLGSGCAFMARDGSGRSFPDGKSLGELHRQAGGEDGGLGGGDIVGDSAPPHVLPVTAVDEVAGTFVFIAGLADGADVDDLFPIWADGFEAGDVERMVLTLDKHGRPVGVADEADPLLLVGKVPGSGGRF